jgi:hypothetical protein
MLYEIVQKKKNKWLQSNDCTIRNIVKYIREKGKLREAQIEAIETYLFLKIEGQNKPLWQLFSEGFFFGEIDLVEQDINQKAREYLEQHKNACALFDFAQKEKVPDLEKKIKVAPDSLNYDKIIKKIFYDVDYADYLMSLPMGAGKTFLMAAFIYLDLYFAQNEPNNKIFAHNFLILVPSGLKSSIVPSLKTIDAFDPSWVLAEPTASNLKRILKFDVLDEQKTSKESNKVRNPNAQKVNACLPNPFGQVFVVNAEKVILESFRFDKQGKLFEDEEKGTTNDLKKLFGQIPNLSIFIDEVHHAATDEKKLRQAVNYWYSKGNITTILGFSGTPYLNKKEKIKIDEGYELSSHQITNTVYYYPLIIAIKKFLKTPTVKFEKNLDRFEIIKRGIEDFNKLYKTKIYKDGTIPKLAIYCSGTTSGIDALEEEIKPFLISKLQINPSEILSFHKGNKKHPPPEGSELEFRSLDLPFSKKRYILLVNIGKEGWDCRSLTGVILSQKGDCPQNMILQTSCRCLRQMDKNTDETALIWLNKDNAKVLDEQLKQEQRTSINELNSIKRRNNTEITERFSRMEFLQLPKIDFYQMEIKYLSIDDEETPNTREKLKILLKNIDDNYHKIVSISTSGIANIDTGEIDIIDNIGDDIADYDKWLFEIFRQSFGLISEEQLHHYDEELNAIFEKISYKKNEQRFFNESYDIHTIQSQIRLAFSIKRKLQIKREVIPEQAELLIVEKLKEVEKNDKLYPSETDTKKILELDSKNESVEIDETEIERAYQITKTKLEEDGLGHMMPSYNSFKMDKEYSLPIKSKNKTFHYLPYNFGGSGSSDFERKIIEKTLQLKDFNNKALEIYYNGERGLTRFVIDCFARKDSYWQNIGKYTTDFLIIKRTDNNKIYKALLVETKGALYANNKVFQKKKEFVETEFLQLNKEKFKYQRFDFIYLEDSKNIDTNIAELRNKIESFFGG